MDRGFAMTGSRLKTGGFLVLTMILVSVAFVAIPSPTASAASTSLTSAASSVELAKLIAVQKYSSAATAVITDTSSYSVHVASNFAGRRRLPLLIGTSGTSPADVLPQLKAWGATKVYLVGASGYFTSAYTSALSGGGISVMANMQSTLSFERWRLAAEPTSSGEYVMARSDNRTAYRIATTYAASRGVAILIWDSSTPATRLKDFFTQVDGATIVIFGDPTVAPKDQMTESQARNALVVDTVDPQRAQLWAASRVQGAGGTTNDVVAAPIDSNIDIALAGLRAKDRNGLALVAGTKASITTSSRADEYLRLWKRGATRVELVGVGVTSSQLSTLALPTTTALIAAPSFRITGLSRNDTDGSYTLSVTAVSGATKYVAYDVAGAVLAQSSSTALKFPKQPGSALVTAQSATRTLSSVNVALNSYRDSGMRSSAMAAQVANGTAHLVVLSAVKTPRLIIRRSVDSFGVLLAEVPVAITCASTFTEGGLNPAVEYRYNVSDFTNVGVKACDPALPAQAATGRTNLSGVSLPPTAAAAQARGDTHRAAAPTLRQKTLLARTITSTTKSAQAGMDWNTWPDVLVRWRAYIPEPYVPTFFSGDPLKPVYALGGDNSGSNPNGSARFTQTATIDFGDDYATRYSETMRKSYGYHCTPFLTCTEVHSGTASLSSLNYRVVNQFENFAWIKFDASAGVPLLPFSNLYAIDTSWELVLSEYDSFAWGSHDNMPKHELWIGVAYSEWFKVYDSPYISFVQAPCLVNPHGSYLPPCGQFFNVNL